MGPTLYILAATILAIVAFAGYELTKRKKRQRALAEPFLESWIEIAAKNIPLYARLPEAMREELHELIKVFLYDKSFEGCGGLELNDEIRVTVAAQACLLLLNKHVRCYPKLRSILIYPSAYVDGGKHNKTPARLGESWSTGIVVLAWDSVKRGAANFADANNVTIHEFAHQLDQEDGAGDGVPLEYLHSPYLAWAKLLMKEHERLKQKAYRGKRSVMSSYGATDLAEFFAVASEAFFEKPHQLNKRHPELYAELMDFYQVDPLEWK
jgi:Mlc titration factor MtfA (ptsG expression regulator)